MQLTRTRGYLGECFAVCSRGPADKATGVLVLPPLGYEDTSSYRPLRVLADAMARAGHLVLRLDWPGLGDSAGAALDEDLHERRLRAVRAGVAALREAGCAKVTGVGVRAGALLGLAAGGLDELVAWGMPPSGKRYLREEKAFHRLAARSFGEVVGDPLPEGSQEAGGFLHGPAVVEALTALTLDTVEVPGRVLLIGRDDAEPDEASVAALAAETLLGSGLGALLENAYHASLDERIREAVVGWLDDEPGAPEHVELADELVGDGWRERPWSLHVGDHQLAGVVCEALRGGQAWQVFFNAGGIRRCGPNRLWTTTARRLAAEGRPSLRFDVHDVGDSDGTDEPWPDLEAMYAEHSIADALAAVDWVEDQGARSIDVAGLCSGAFLGAQTSARRTIRRAVLFNGLAFVWDDDARASSMTAHIRGSLFDARRWKRLLTGKIDARALARSIASKARLRAARIGRSAERDPVDALMEVVRDRGTELVLVSSERDPSIAYLEGHVPTERRPALTLLPGADHTIRPVQLHPKVVDLIAG